MVKYTEMLYQVYFLNYSKTFSYFHIIEIRRSTSNPKILQICNDPKIYYSIVKCQTMPWYWDIISK